MTDLNPFTHLIEAHKRCNRNKPVLEQGEDASCFYCCTTFKVAGIKEWIRSEQTALCPRCGIDSVLPGLLEQSFLQEMQDYWFGKSHPMRVPQGGRPV